MFALRKCIVWDLDNTLWDGICLEGEVTVRPVIRSVISRLDQKGILHSIASRNEKQIAQKVLQDQKLFHFFVAPRINWLPKTTNILDIAKQLRITLDSVAFVDDDPFERDQVRFMLPDVMTIDAKDAAQLPDLREFSPGFLTQESKSRREYYHAEEKRQIDEQKFATREDFLMSCNMRLSIRPMQQKDIPRVLELMTRTHQLNTTGQIFEENQLVQIVSLHDLRYSVFIAEFEDKFGWNGIVGTAVVEKTTNRFRIILFAMSCRILGRGIERAFLASLVKAADKTGHSGIEALYKETGRNSMMRILYQMSGFRQASSLSDQTLIFTLNCDQGIDVPRWVEVM
jgi:FkbH-like protein